MKWMLFCLLVSFNMQAETFFVYLTSETKFHVLNSDRPELVNAAWLELSQPEMTVRIKLENGKTLLHTLNGIHPKAQYKIVYNKLRYRPNMTISSADTMKIRPVANAIAERESNDKTPTDAPTIDIKKIQNIPYEWEKMEAVIGICQANMPACDTFLEMMALLKYDPSRVEVLNALGNKVPQDCKNKVLEKIPEHLQKTLK